MPKIKEALEFTEDTGNARGEAYFFSGREKEIGIVKSACASEIRRRARAQADERGRKAVNGLVAFTGPPGAGKTALQHQAGVSIGEELEGRDEQGPPSGLVRTLHEILGKSYEGEVLVVDAVPKDLTSEEGFFKHCAAKAHALMGRLPDEAQEYMRYAARGRVNDALNAIGSLGLARRPLVLLLVDEAQQSTEENEHVYSKLHLGHYGLPIVTVLAGLSNTMAKMEEIGLSRIGEMTHVRLGALEEKDCASAMRAMLAEFEFEAEDPERWERFAAESSTGFPQHLQNALVATALTAAAQGGRLTDDDVARAYGTMEERKASYYEKRSEGFSNEELSAAAEVVASLASDDKRVHTAAANALRRMNAAMGHGDREVDENHFVERMVRKGMLQRKEGLGYEAPIPSFSHWLQANYPPLGHNRQGPGP